MNLACASDRNPMGYEGVSQIKERIRMKRSWMTLLAALLANFAMPGMTLAVDDRRPDFAEFDRRAKAGERLTVVFFGASLTWGANATDPLLTSYRAVMANRLEQKYPAAHFTFRDGAIGGTG